MKDLTKILCSYIGTGLKGKTYPYHGLTKSEKYLPSSMVNCELVGIVKSYEGIETTRCYVQCYDVNNFKWDELTRVPIEDFKPILRPLSQLTEKIKEGGKEFCIMSLWFSVEAKEEEDYNLYGKIPDYWETVTTAINNTGFKYIDHGFVELCHKYHFDTYGLIESGQAISIEDYNITYE